MNQACEWEEDGHNHPRHHMDLEENWHIIHKGWFRVPVEEAVEPRSDGFPVVKLAWCIPKGGRKARHDGNGQKEIEPTVHGGRISFHIGYGKSTPHQDDKAQEEDDACWHPHPQGPLVVHMFVNAKVFCTNLRHQNAHYVTADNHQQAQVEQGIADSKLFLFQEFTGFCGPIAFKVKEPNQCAYHKEGEGNIWECSPQEISHVHSPPIR